MRESSTHTSIKLCVRITIQNGSSKALNSKNTVNTNLTTISHVAQCALFGTLHRKEAERNILATFYRNI